MRARLPLLLVLLASLSCFEKVDDGAATRAQGWDGVSTDHLIPGDRTVFTTVDEDDQDTAATGCDKTTADAMNILKTYCSMCHDRGPASFGTSPVFSFVLDPYKLTTTYWERSTGNVRFVKPGDPDNSYVYVRAVILRDMPIGGSDLGQDSLPRVTFSEGSVLREWIEHCMGPDPLASSGGSGGGAGGAGGSGATGNDGAAGAAGAN